jgi:hypothetical protein
MSTPQQKAARRRRCRPGFPKEFVFSSYSDLQNYFSGDCIQCLRCGKSFRALGIHLKSIHGIDPDEYREMYGIPWTYGLDCNETTNIRSEIAVERGIGGNRSLEDVRAMAALARVSQRKRQPVRIDVCRMNVEKAHAANLAIAASRPKVEKPQKPQRVPKPKPARRGTPEFHEKMKHRPQCNNPSFIYWWKGKKQSRDHVLKRTGHEPQLHNDEAKDGTAQG